LCERKQSKRIVIISLCTRRVTNIGEPRHRGLKEDLIVIFSIPEKINKNYVGSVSKITQKSLLRTEWNEAIKRNM